MMCLALAGDERLAGRTLLHENQLTYPLQPGEKRDLHYGFINFVSALRADAVFFNSAYHLTAFFDELSRMLKHFPDYNELWAVEALRAKSQVLPLGLDLVRFDAHRPAHTPVLSSALRDGPEGRGAKLVKGRHTAGRPLILWNHRWEYDKAPETFFRAVYALAEEADATASGLDFGLLLLGRSFRNQPDEFLEVRERLPERIVHFGYAPDAATYSRLLWQADVVVSTALHDFFGAAVVEACYCGCFPVLPRRLAYPELIPAAQHEACLYDDFEGLLTRLRHAITHVQATRAFSLQEHVARFDWERMAPLYDAALAPLAKGK